MYPADLDTLRIIRDTRIETALSVATDSRARSKQRRGTTPSALWNPTGRPSWWRIRKEHP